MHANRHEFFYGQGWRLCVQHALLQRPAGAFGRINSLTHGNAQILMAGNGPIFGCGLFKQRALHGYGGCRQKCRGRGMRFEGGRQQRALRQCQEIAAARSGYAKPCDLLNQRITIRRGSRRNPARQMVSAAVGSWRGGWHNGLRRADHHELTFVNPPVIINFPLRTIS